MTALSIPIQRAFLDAIYGPVTGDVEVELWAGDPDAGGSEVTGGGYAPGTLADSGWDAADAEGVKSASAAVDCGTPTEAWSATVTYFRLVRVSDGEQCGAFPLADPLDVGGAGSAVLVLPQVFFGENDNN